MQIESKYDIEVLQTRSSYPNSQQSHHRYERLSHPVRSSDDAIELPIGPMRASAFVTWTCMKVHSAHPWRFKRSKSNFAQGPRYPFIYLLQDCQRQGMLRAWSFRASASPGGPRSATWRLADHLESAHYRAVETGGSGLTLTGKWGNQSAAVVDNIVDRFSWLLDLQNRPGQRKSIDAHEDMYCLHILR